MYLVYLRAVVVVVVVVVVLTLTRITESVGTGLQDRLQTLWRGGIPGYRTDSRHSGVEEYPMEETQTKYILYLPGTSKHAMYIINS